MTTGQFCNLIHRDPLTGSLWRGDTGWVSTNLNIGAQKTDGVDLRWARRSRIGAALLYRWSARSLLFRNNQRSGLGSYDCAGLYGVNCGTPLPEWRTKLRGTWNTRGSTRRSRWPGATSGEGRYQQQSFACRHFRPVTLGTQNYIDLAASWTIDKTFTLYRLQQRFDKDPPVLSQTIAGPPYGNGNAYPQVYDALGRNLFLGLSAKF